VNIVEFNNVGTFEAMRSAEAWLDARGFSVGPSQADGPRAIWHGDCWISKWRNLSAKEKASAHAIMDGDMREGPVRIVLRAAATEAARMAFALTDSDVAATASQPSLDEVTGACRFCDGQGEVQGHGGAQDIEPPIKKCSACGGSGKVTGAGKGEGDA
jgi:hypothetical protein